MKTVSLVIVLGLVLNPICQVAAENKVASALYRQGLQKYVFQDFAGAITDFQDAHRLEKDSKKIRKMLSNALTRQGKIEYKKGKYQKAETLLSGPLPSGSTRRISAMCSCC